MNESHRIQQGKHKQLCKIVQALGSGSFLISASERWLSPGEVLQPKECLLTYKKYHWILQPICFLEYWTFWFTRRRSGAWPWMPLHGAAYLRHLRRSLMTWTFERNLLALFVYLIMKYYDWNLILWPGLVTKPYHSHVEQQTSRKGTRLKELKRLSFGRIWTSSSHKGKDLGFAELVERMVANRQVLSEHLVNLVESIW